MTDARTEHIDAFGGSQLFEVDGCHVSIVGCWDHVEAHCHGLSEHYREDGGCEHLDELLTVQAPGRDVRIVPFGGT